eukprot:CAMPEP_0114260920 /NCGR_PEP_ID=MMETSP0058-20121206/20791_1 /TAXON_ID=36894 /ORGANISM="Pyramimonas parkeae, CCMP726" /LENGTH=90 /DNA_ID=CAMNT_0001376281 /DNA_START=163 /DNA_END=432 /DNA_ORIENTATION=+
MVFYPMNMGKLPQEGMKRFPVPKLYRHILKAAAQFPSSNRSSIIEEIKEEFRASRALTDQEEIKKRRALAVESLRKLEVYSTLNKEGHDW